MISALVPFGEQAFERIAAVRPRAGKLHDKKCGYIPTTPGVCTAPVDVPTHAGATVLSFIIVGTPVGVGDPEGDGGKSSVKKSPERGGDNHFTKTLKTH